MTFDFSHLYKREIAEVKGHDGTVLFTAIIREVTHGEKTDAQTQMMREVDIPMTKNKAQRERQVADELKRALQNGVSGKISLVEELAAIESWTLTDADGSDIPVCLEAWRALPAFLAQQIVTVIERINPDLDDDFRSDAGSASEAGATVQSSNGRTGLGGSSPDEEGA